MSLKFFIDIETLPPSKDDLVRFPKVCDCDEQEFRNLALTGDYGRVLTIGVIIEQDGVIIQSGCLGRDRSSMNFHLEERRTLSGFWKLFTTFNPSRDLIVGHNIISFDLPFIYKQSVINRVGPSVTLCFARYRSRPVFDTMREWDKWDLRKYTSLDELARILGLESSKDGGMDGSRVYDRFREGEHADIASYCMADVCLTRRIYYRMIRPEGPDPEEPANSNSPAQNQCPIKST
jgi:3'-5' exonuclease